VSEGDPEPEPAAQATPRGSAMGGLWLLAIVAAFVVGVVAVRHLARRKEAPEAAIPAARKLRAPEPPDAGAAEVSYARPYTGPKRKAKREASYTVKARPAAATEGRAPMQNLTGVIAAPGGAGIPEAPHAEPVSGAMRITPRQVPITIYTTQWCGPCKRSKAWLRDHGYGFVERDVEGSEEASRAHRALNPSGGVPTWDIDGKTLVGFSPQSVQAAIDEAGRRRL
jgi:glutaredoxin